MADPGHRTEEMQLEIGSSGAPSPFVRRFHNRERIRAGARLQSRTVPNAAGIRTAGRFGGLKGAKECPFFFSLLLFLANRLRDCAGYGRTGWSPYCDGNGYMHFSE
jgi:hypothetical protein